MAWHQPRSRGQPCERVQNSVGGLGPPGLENSSLLAAKRSRPAWQSPRTYLEVSVYPEWKCGHRYTSSAFAFGPHTLYHVGPTPHSRVSAISRRWNRTLQHLLCTGLLGFNDSKYSRPRFGYMKVSKSCFVALEDRERAKGKATQVSMHQQSLTACAYIQI